MMNNGLWTPPKLVQWIADDFSAQGLPGPLRLEAERLVAHALNISRLDIYLQFEKPCTSEEQALVRELVIRRRNREPLPYIMGSADFRSLTLDVGPGVLIPRPETELLVDVVLEVIGLQRSTGRCDVLELGTGSAAIPIALAMEAEDLTVTSTDISTQALEYAQKNVARYRGDMEARRCRIELVHSDRFNAIRRNPDYDCIVSNPPYIPSREIGSLQAEVRQWEPGEALDGGGDGLDFYRYLAVAAVDYLKPGGFLIFEHGFDQQAAILKIIQDSDRLDLHDTTRDYNGHDRIVTIQKTG